MYIFYKDLSFIWCCLFYKYIFPTALTYLVCRALPTTLDEAAHRVLTVVETGVNVATTYSFTYKVFVYEAPSSVVNIQ